jgi:predicted Zn-dependent protease
MENYFRELSAAIFSQLKDDEVLLLNYAGEDSDFARFNHGHIRQAGHVRQQSLQLDLIDRHRQCHAAFNLSGQLSEDQARAKELLHLLREQLNLLPEDPYIHFATEPNNTRHASENHLPDVGEAVSCIVDAAQDLDLVGIWASGELSQGFANSLGQFNWHTDYNFNFDWSVYHQGDKAVKQNYAGFDWDPEYLQQKLAYARETLPLLGKPPRTIAPGHYRVFLAPAALQEILELLNWGGFGLKSHRTAQTPLLKMIKEDVRLNAQVRIVENHRQGLVPSFSREGFVLPDSVSLIDDGMYQQCLANQRSAKEYGTTVNCDIEHPRSMDVDGGELHQDKVLGELGTGVYISNLWYCNYSDRNNCRMTGMTRFACLWVENGVPVAPLNVMRFDESVLDMLGPKLIALTEEREQIFDPCTYEHRSNASWRLPGALVDGFTFTL